MATKKRASITDRAAAPSGEPELTDVEKATKREQLLQQLADLGPEPVKPGHKRVPGAIVGTGVNQDRIDFKTEDFMQQELKEVLETEENLPITVQGVTFMVYRGYNCKLPMSHYQVYLNYKQNKRRNEERYAPPTTFSNLPGYMPPVHMQGVGPLPSRESEGRTGESRT